jgi:hypothetical protein
MMEHNDIKETLVFYTTDGCHLCEDGEKIFKVVLNPEVYDVQYVDIAESNALIEQYGLTIPVLKRLDTAAELNWPFSMGTVMKFLSD